jgi:ABC-type antimicrobial peptide transport system permease subunit
MELFEVDESKISEAISIEMDEEKMRQMYYSQASSQEASLRGNLLRFGYANPAQPAMITIYPNNFEGKDQVIALLDAYNATMEKEGYPEKVISYTDYVGSLMSSVTTIIDVITYVLIAFVAVSLVVSSIMIGIITYISVLERRKEIGILRAMGASKRNVTSVFNAETFIIGLLAGALGIGLTLLLQIPINYVIRTLANQEGIRAFLPPGAGGILIALCVLLNMIGGFIPARKAARQDPVEALRSE